MRIDSTTTKNNLVLNSFTFAHHIYYKESWCLVALVYHKSENKSALYTLVITHDLIFKFKYNLVVFICTRKQNSFNQYVKMFNERKLNTDGKTTYSILKTRLQVINETIDYDKEDHHLYFLNKIISNLNQYLLHVYH